MNQPLNMMQLLQMALEVTPSGVVGHFAGARLASVFQPVLSRDGRTIGFEALVRAQRSDGQALTPPQLFAPVSDEADLVHLDRLCRALHVRNFVRSAEADSLLFLNVHPVVSIRGRHYGNFFAEFLAQVGLPPERVVIEILENSVLDDRQLAESISFYRERGCRVAIDDFGVGHSNFGRIWQIKPHLVKLDRSTLAYARTDDAVRRMLPGLVELLHEAGCSVLMEGIEDAFGAELAGECGVDLVQGYYYGRPQPR